MSAMTARRSSSAALLEVLLTAPGTGVAAGAVLPAGPAASPVAMIACRAFKDGHTKPPAAADAAVGDVTVGAVALSGARGDGGGGAALLSRETLLVTDGTRLLHT